MHFDDINKKPSGDSETSFYENTAISSATLKNAENSKPEQTRKGEEVYEQLRLERKRPLKEEDALKRIKLFMYIILVLVIVLFMTVIALIIVVAVPKYQDGGWTSWGNWVSCKESSGLGVQSRARTCSNPLPSLTGKHCDGNQVEVRACTEAGRDGGWTSWGNWVSCKESSGLGVQSRVRTCSNPLPSLTGKYCDGNQVEVRACTEAGRDGVWSLWENWGPCSESCGIGVRTRSRSCTNPTPSLTGRSCAGDYTDVSTCNRTTCPEHNVAFTADNIHKNSSNYTTLRFRNTYINNGKAYNTTTGNFTCYVPGVYHFVMTLTKELGDISYVRAFLRINGRYKLPLFFNPINDDSNERGMYMMSGAGTFHLDQNDIVDVYGVPYNYHNGHYSYFTGFLITPDQ